MIKKIQLVIMLGIALSIMVGSGLGVADETKKKMEEMQKKLNAEVVSQPFNVVDEAEVQSYIEDAKRRGMKPQEYTGTHWRPGYTCRDLSRYSRRDYLDCRYYKSYYGHYYR